MPGYWTLPKNPKAFTHPKQKYTRGHMRKFNAREVTVPGHLTNVCAANGL